MQILCPDPRNCSGRMTLLIQQNQHQWIGSAESFGGCAGR